MSAGRNKNAKNDLRKYQQAKAARRRAERRQRLIAERRAASKGQRA